MANNDLLQSDGWERFQRALGRRTHRVDGVLAIEMPLPFGLKYLYAPRAAPPCHPEAAAPCPSVASRGEGKDLTSSVERIARETDAVFWRAEFDRQVSPLRSRFAGQAGVRCQVSEPRVMRRLVEPEWTWRTSLTESDTTRLAAMHEKHRYNIRLAERRGVVVRVTLPPHAPPPGEGGKEKSFLPLTSGGGATRPAKLGERSGRGGGDIDVFWSLLQDTAKRQRIATHPRSYYETMLKTLGSQVLGVRCQVFVAAHDRVPLAAAIVAYHGDTVTYLHGGSSYEHRALMAPHLLHWQAMRDAKAAGMRWYDFGGVAAPETIGHENYRTIERSNVLQFYSSTVLQFSSWSGMTRFKQGFGGEAVHHPQPMDLVFRPNWYRLLSWIAKLRS